MKKLFAVLMIAMLVVLPMTAMAKNEATLTEFMVMQDPAVVNAINAVDYLTPEEPKPLEVVVEAPATGVFTAVAASAALIAMGLVASKKN